MKYENAYLKISPHMVFREEEDGALFFNSKTGELYGLNQTGIEVLKLCNGKCNVSYITKCVSEQYPDIPISTIEKDVEKLIQELLDKGYIEIK